MDITIVYIYTLLLHIYIVIQPQGSLLRRSSQRSFPKMLSFYEFWRYVKCYQFHLYIICLYFGLSPVPVTVANEGLSGFPTKKVIILQVLLGSCLYSLYIYTCYYSYAKKYPVFWGISATSTKAVWYVWSGAWKNWSASWLRRRRPLEMKSWPCHLAISKSWV